MERMDRTLEGWRQTLEGMNETLEGLVLTLGLWEPRIEPVETLRPRFEPPLGRWSRWFSLLPFPNAQTEWNAE